MCTVLILRHIHPRWPLVLAANRDEFYARPAEGPQVLLSSPRAVGGRDLERQGTWMGVTDRGLFVGLTNQRGHAGKGPAARSRGEVVLRCLEAGSVEGVERYLASLHPEEYHPFNLLYGTAEVLRVAYVRSESLRVEPREVPAGVHVLPNDELNAEALPKVGRLRQRAEPLVRLEGEELLRALQELLVDHMLPEVHAGLMSPEDPPEVHEWARQLQALCIHTPAYGTRSSAIVALEPGRVARYLASDAPPCQGPFRDVTGLVYPPLPQL